jgi:hypothetical protein
MNNTIINRLLLDRYHLPDPPITSINRYLPFFFLEMDNFGPFLVEYTFTFPTLAKNPISIAPFLSAYLYHLCK